MIKSIPLHLDNSRTHKHYTVRYNIINFRMYLFVVYNTGDSLNTLLTRR